MKWSASRTCIVLYLFWLASASSQAQATWNGLQFGMTVAAVRSQLAARSLELVATEGKPDRFTVAPAYTVQTQGMISSIDFTVEMDFEKAGLAHVGLKLDKATMFGGKTAEGLLLPRALPQEVQNLLSSKYGKPVDIQGGCDNSMERLIGGDVPSVMTCETTWRDAGQQIVASWYYSIINEDIQVPVPGKNKTKHSTKLEQKFGYQIDYRPQTAAL